MNQPSRWGEPPLIAEAVAAVLACAVVFAVACSDSPSPTSSSTPTPARGPTVASSTNTPAATDPAPDSQVAIKIRDNGKVINNTGTTYTACLYHKPFGGGVLVDDWKAKPGVTQSDYKNPGCDPSIGQIDVILGVCPPTPHGLSAVAANPNVRIPAEKTAEECKECVPVEWYLKVEGVWGECELEDGIVAPNGCYECRTNIWSDGCKEEPRPEKRQCGCVEWPEPRVECGEFNKCHEHPTASTGGPQCFQEQECVRYWNCQDPEPFENSRPCDCPEECVLPEPGIVLDHVPGGPQAECSAYGPYEAVCKTEDNDITASGEELPPCGEADFYICKQATLMVSTLDPIEDCGLPNPGRSHLTGCDCRADLSADHFLTR